MSDGELLGYTSIPAVDVPSTVALASAVLQRTPRKAPEGVRKAARKLRDALEVLRTAWESRTTAAPLTVTRKEADRRVDAAWGALFARLEAWLKLVVELEEQESAAYLVERLFPEGLVFLTLPHKAQWAEGDKRLKQIDGEGLVTSIDRLAGPAFLAEVRAAQQLYGEVLGILATPADKPNPLSVQEPLLNVRRALRAYALQVIAATDEEDEAAVAVLHKLLAPIDEARAPRAGSNDPAADGAAPKDRGGNGSSENPTPDPDA